MPPDRTAASTAADHAVDPVAIAVALAPRCGLDPDGIAQWIERGAMAPLTIALDLAARAGDVGIATRLLDAGADPSAIVEMRGCVLSSSMIDPRWPSVGSIEVADLLIARGAVVRSIDPLFLMRMGSPIAPGWLVEHGAGIPDADSIASFAEEMDDDRFRTSLVRLAAGGFRRAVWAAAVASEAGIALPDHPGFPPPTDATEAAWASDLVARHADRPWAMRLFAALAAGDHP